MAQQNADLESLWEEAVREYFSKTQQKPDAQKWTQSMTTQADLNDLIEQQEAEFSQFRSSHKIFWDGLRETMGQLQNIGGIAQAALQFSPFAPAAVIVQAGLGLVRAGAAVSETYDDLETLFRTVRDITDRVDEYLRGTMDDKIHRVLIRLLTSLLDAFGEGAATVQRGRGKELIRRVLKREDKIKSALQRVQELERSEIALVAATTRSAAQRTEKKIDDERHRILLREKLCADAAADNEKFGKDIESSRLSQSGAWILEEELYKEWFAMKFPVLWVLGQPGAGKTYLASRIISEIRGNSHLTSYFYMRESMNTQHTLEVLIKVISYQITRLQDTYRKRIVQYCSGDDIQSISGMTWEELFTKLLVEPLREDAAKPVFVVIDGVDEATSTEQELIVKLAKKLSDLQNTSNRQPKLQLLLLARPELQYNISNTWQGARRLPRMLRIEPAMSKSDIENFVRERVEKDVYLLRKLQPKQSKALKKYIVKTISNSSDGMFLLAKLMLTELEKMNKVELIRETLAKPPKGLNDMFQRVITRLDMIGGFDKQDFNELIMWVACAKRDLLVGELDLILKLRDVRQNGIAALDEELRTRFGSFFSVISTESDMDEEEQKSEDAVSAPGSDTDPGSSVSGATSGVDSEDENRVDESSEDETDMSSHESLSWEFDEIVPRNYFTATVKFSHASVGQYFRRAPLHQGMGMDSNFAQAHIALTCSQCLTDNLPKRRQGSWRNRYLFDYSASHILDHIEEVNFEQLKSCHPDIHKRLSGAVVALFTDLDSINDWISELSNMHKFIHQLFSQSICLQLQNCVSGASIHQQKGMITFVKDEQSRNTLEPLLEPFAHSMIDAWLNKGSCDGVVAIVFLYGFHSLNSEDRKELKLPRNRPFEHIVRTIPPEQIISMVSLNMPKKDLMFHYSLASTFANIRTTQHLKSAIEEYDSALQLAEESTRTWLLHQGKARIFLALSMLDEAVEAASTALKCLSESEVDLDAETELLQLLTEANLSLGNRVAAFKAAKKARDTDPWNADEAFNLIVAAHRTGNHSETTEILRSALNSQEEATFIGRILFDPSCVRVMMSYILLACIETGDLDLARAVFQTVELQADERGDTEITSIARLALGRTYFDLYQEDNKAIAMWESIVEEFPGTVAAFEASFTLMSWYVSKARNVNSSEASTWETKMERLVEAVELMVPRLYMFQSHHEAAAILAQWYKMQGRVEKARAKVRPFIRDSIKDLKDQDQNEYRAYHRLARALLCSGDRTNAAIAWAFTKPLDSNQELLEEGLQVNVAWNNTLTPSFPYKRNSLGGIFGYCDGGCTRRNVEFKSWSFCEVCVDTGFCDECHQKVGDGTLRLRICDPKHPHFEIYPPRGLITKGPEGYRVHLEDGREVSDEEWLNMISREWM